MLPNILPEPAQPNDTISMPDVESVVGPTNQLINEPKPKPNRQNFPKVTMGKWSHADKPGFKLPWGLIAGIIGILIVVGIVIIILYKPKVTFGPKTAQTTIIVDNQPTTVSTLTLSPGQHTITISQNGHVPYTFNDELKPFKRLKLNFSLRPLPTAKQLVSETAFAASFPNGGKEFYYLGNGGKTLYKTLVLTDKDGNNRTIEKTPITPDQLPSLTRVVFSPDFSVAMFKKTDNDTGLYDFKRYDLLHQEYVSWGKDIGDVAWSPNGKQVAYYYAPTDDKAIVVSDPAHQNVKRLVDLRKVGFSASPTDANSPTLTWSRDGKLLSIIYNGTLWVMDLATQTMTQVVKTGVTDVQFGPDSRHILYTQNGSLFWLNAEPVNALKGSDEDKKHVGEIKAGEPIPFNIVAKANKGVFTIDGKKLIILSQDGIKQVDLTNNQVSPFYLKGNVSQVTDLGLSSDGKVLYALNQKQILVIPLDSGDY